jgi:outer membrane lipoprotein-sorting protein
MLLRILAGLALATVVSLPATAQTADELIDRNISAKGGLERLKGIRSVRMTGTMTSGPMELPIVLEIKRPNLVRMDVSVQGMTGTQAYDGKTGWMFLPFMGQAAPEPLPQDLLEQMEEQADFDGPFVDYRAKGNKVEFAGKAQVNGTDTYKLEVTLKKGDVRYFFLDAATYLEIRSEARRTVGPGEVVDTESTMGDYKEVEGVMFPHLVEGGPKGSVQRQKMTIHTIEVNVPIDDARFRMPTVKR